MKKKIPDFDTEAEEAAFWATHAIEDYADSLEEMPPLEVPPEARTEAVSVRLSVKTIAALKRAAESRGVGYQALMKQWIEERLEQANDGFGASSDDIERER